MTDNRQMSQVAPYPAILAELVGRLRYRGHLGWEVWLDDDCQRDKPGRHSGESRGLTLVVKRSGTNTYNPSQPMEVNHYFAVPPATYNGESWMRWLFNRLGDVDTHERMEDFALAGEGDAGPRDWTRPYKPVHAPGWDPYLVTVESTDVARRTSFRGELNPG